MFKNKILFIIGWIFTNSVKMCVSGNHCWNYNSESKMMILYSVSDGPPSVAVRMGLELLNLEYKLQEVDFGTGEHLNDWYAEVNLSMSHLIYVI